ncbi:MAG: hypothetical protein HUK40_12880 [Desulfobacter sp.]|nr:hypothetical protein [Desulfobacter sp.]WDP87852.1 MAG: hypothetical protein HUN05_00475 [Desulfobacter sp.]
MTRVALFKPYPFKLGQKICIQDSVRSGDWEVVKVTDHKITLRCPISKKEFAWSRFCYLAAEEERGWPAKD